MRAHEAIGFRLRLVSALRDLARALLSPPPRPDLGFQHV